MIIDHAVADELDLRNARDGLQVRMQDGRLGRPDLVVAVTVALTRRVECLSPIPMLC